MNMKKIILAASIGLCCTCLTGHATEITVTVGDFIDPNKSNPQESLISNFGNSLYYDGFELRAYINGEMKGDLCIAHDKMWKSGLGVGGKEALSFSRSINNNGTISESISLYISPRAGNGTYGELTSIGFNRGAGSIVISGFSEDPQASAASGSVMYQGGTVTWQSRDNLDQSLVFSNPRAVAPGSTLSISNGNPNYEENSFGLMQFTYNSSRNSSNNALEKTPPETVPENYIQLQQVPEKPTKKSFLPVILSVSIFIGAMLILAIIAIVRRQKS